MVSSLGIGNDRPSFYLPRTSKTEEERERTCFPISVFPLFYFFFFFFFDNSARSSTRVERTSLLGNVTGGKEEERREFLSDSAIPKVFREISF